MGNFKQTSTWFRLSIAIILIIGIFFRFVNLDRKVYWHDEVHTSLRISGYQVGEAIEQLFVGQIITPEDILKFQRPAPDKDLKDAINVFIKSAEHPPLYYLIARYWVIFATILQPSKDFSVAIIRSLSAIVSLLIFPALYWLCRELFTSPKVALIAIALIAISPFHVLYAQEAREYSLWTLTILLSSASLLRAIRLQKTATTRKIFFNWGIYAVTLVLAFYTSLFSLFLPITHGIYVIAIEGFRLTKTLKLFLLVIIISLLSFSPWVVAIIANFSRIQASTRWLTLPSSTLTLIKYWELNFSSIFIDINLEFNHWLIPRISLVLFGFISYSIYTICRNTPRKIWLFVVALMAVTSIGIILPDLTFGGQRSAVARYFIPSYLAIHLAVAYLLSNGKLFSRKISSIFLIGFILCGIISCAIASKSDTWWNKIPNYYYPEIARAINPSPHPLLIAENYEINFGNIISLSYLLEPQVKLLLLPSQTLPQIPDEFQDIFLFNPSFELLSAIEKKLDYQLDVVNVRSSNPFFKMIKNPAIKPNLQQ